MELPIVTAWGLSIQLGDRLIRLRNALRPDRRMYRCYAITMGTGRLTWPYIEMGMVYSSLFGWWDGGGGVGSSAGHTGARDYDGDGRTDM